MARPPLTRIWAESPTQFEEPSDATWTLGWEGGADKDPPQAKWENWWHNRVDQLLRQVERDGGMEWLSVTPYRKWALAKASNGELYIAIQASTGVDPVSDDGTNWMTLPDYIYSLFNAQGQAPLFGVRAWANFGGVGGVTMVASGNISSITRLSEGTYQVTFQTQMQDAGYSVSPGGAQFMSDGARTFVDGISAYDLTPQGFKVSTYGSATENDKTDFELITFQVVR